MHPDQPPDYNPEISLQFFNAFTIYAFYLTYLKIMDSFKNHWTSDFILY